MATDILMPQLSDTMSSGKILNWNKKEGDAVQRGDILAEVETDKANLEIESFQSGTLLKIVTAVGETAGVGAIIAVIGQAGESVDTGGARTATPAASAPVQIAALDQKESVPVQAAPAPNLHIASSASSERIKASPLARKIAEQKNIPLQGIVGTGPEGRIVRRDVEAGGDQVAVPTSQVTTSASQTAKSSPSPQASGPLAGQLQPMSKVRETIARRMQQTVLDSPHFYVTTSVIMDEAIRLRELLKEDAEYKGMSINHLVIKAAAYALVREPRVHYAVRENNMVFQPAEINIGIITALDDGLLIPVIRQADKLCMKDLVFEARAAVERARAGRPSPNDLIGGTFSISNMGMYDVENFTALINPGQGSILAVSSTKDTPIIRNGAIIAAKVMKATISVDHRIIDGAMASQFMKHFAQALEVPALLFT